MSKTNEITDNESGERMKGMAQRIEKARFGGKRNIMVDTFIEILKENPDIEFLGVDGTRVNWRFEIGSKPVQDIAPGLLNYANMNKEQRRAYDKLEKKYQKKVIKEVRNRLGSKRIMDEIMQ